MAFQNPVIVVPGITASDLRDEYSTSPESVWSLLSKRYERVVLHPDDLRYEREQPSRVVADRLFSIPYDELIQELRHDLTPGKKRQTPMRKSHHVCNRTHHTKFW